MPALIEGTVVVVVSRNLMSKDMPWWHAIRLHQKLFTFKHEVNSTSYCAYQQWALISVRVEFDFDTWELEHDPASIDQQEGELGDLEGNCIVRGRGDVSSIDNEAAGDDAP